MTGSELRELRDNRGISIRALAKRLQMSEETVSRYESGKRPIPFLVECFVKRIRKKSRLVSEVTAESMAGDTPLEKSINAFLTKKFIATVDVPADECLAEAKFIVALFTESDPCGRCEE